MNLENPAITILVNDDSINIELYDSLSNTRFADIKLTPKQFASALGRLSHTPCEITLRGIERVGKKMLHKKHAFPISENIPYEKMTEILSEEIKKTLPDGWISDNHFASQDTFFKKDGIQYAQTTIRTWV